MLKKEIVRNNWTARKAPKGFQIKNNFFVPGLLTLALAFALIFTGCRSGDNNNGGFDPKTLIITGIPSDVFNDLIENYGYYSYTDNKYIFTGGIGLYPIGTNYQQTTGGASVPGADLHNYDIIISGSGPYTMTIPLYTGHDRWNGIGTFDVYLKLWYSDYSRYYRADSISFFSETTIVPFSNATAFAILYELDQNEFVRCSTNDPREYNWARWRLFENGNDENTYEIDCKKISGASYNGYGLLFGASDTDVYKYYYLTIWVDGTYSISKSTNNVDDLTDIKEREESDKLHTGYNVTNTLKVVKNGGEYTVYLNDSQVYEFTDSDISGNRLGYRVSIGSQNAELFPNTPVDVRFKRK